MQGAGSPHLYVGLSHLLSASIHRAKCCRGVAATMCLFFQFCYGRVITVGLIGILEVCLLSYSLFLHLLLGTDFLSRPVVIGQGIMILN